MSPLPPTRERPVSVTPPDELGLPPEPARSRRRWLRRLGVILIVCLAVLLGAVAAVLVVAKQEIDDLVTPRTAEMRAAQKQLKAPLPNTPTNIMLLGSDRRKNLDESDKRSDTLMVVRLDPKRETISIISFPRDLWVPIPGHGEAKINDAYHYGGPELSVRTVKEITGLDINMVMNVDFDGFRGVVNELGGVWVDVDRTYFDNVPNQTSDIDLKPGYQLLRGEQALQFARFRHDAKGDFNRIARQQQVLAGLKKQVGSSSLAKNVPGLFRVFKKNTEVVAGGGDNVDARVLYDYLRLALELEHKDVYEIEYDGETGEAANGASIVVYDEAKMDEVVDAFLAPNPKAREATADQLVGTQQKAEAPAGSEEADAAAAAQDAPAAPAPSTVSVTVLNGSGVGGAASTMAQSLGAAGYRVDPNLTNADSSNYASTKVFYATAAAKPAAESIADGIEGATTGAKEGSNDFSTQVLVVVGRVGTTFEADGADGTVGVDDGPEGGSTYEGNAVPEKGQANVVPDLESAREQFFEVELKRLPVMVPAVREESSSYEEAYAYEFARGQKGSQTVYEAYRLVAQTAEGDYWGLQGMTWHDPPILEGPTREVIRRGRTYRLYFNGTRLHMVAWRQGAGTYWVANSVLNTLSNETMLAIAESARVSG